VPLAHLGFSHSLGMPHFTVVKTLYCAFIAPRICPWAASLCSHGAPRFLPIPSCTLKERCTISFPYHHSLWLVLGSWDNVQFYLTFLFLDSRADAKSMLQCSSIPRVPRAPADMTMRLDCKAAEMPMTTLHWWWLCAP
jgi:hypothetical protein